MADVERHSTREIVADAWSWEHGDVYAGPRHFGHNPSWVKAVEYDRLRADRDALLAALKRMDALMTMLWDAVPWGDTFNLDAALLNEAPMEAKRAIANAEG